MQQLLSGVSALGDATFVRVRPPTDEERARVLTIDGSRFVWTDDMAAMASDRSVGIVAGGNEGASVVAFDTPQHVHAYVYADAQLVRVDSDAVPAAQRDALRKALTLVMLRYGAGPGQTHHELQLGLLLAAFAALSESLKRLAQRVERLESRKRGRDADEAPE